LKDQITQINATISEQKYFLKQREDKIQELKSQLDEFCEREGQLSYETIPLTEKEKIQLHESSEKIS